MMPTRLCAGRVGGAFNPPTLYGASQLVSPTRPLFVAVLGASVCDKRNTKLCFTTSIKRG